MGLTIGNGPLSPQRPSDLNYRLDGPEHLLFFDDFPRRVRATFADTDVVDTRRGRLLHESGALPVLYVPDDDIAAEVLRPTEHSTHCPFKGDAAYWTVHVADRTAENAVWAYPDPIPAARWLRGYKAVHWEAMDAWYDEDEQVYGHLRDPYHRVDVRASSGRVRVMADGELLAESTRVKVLSETGLPNRYYLPREDVHVTLSPSETTMVCPYKGTSSYWSTPALTDVGWTYEEPLEDAAKIAGHVCFLHDDLTIEVD
jgi:uncharacterized protein (DUF427 family)